MIPIMETWRRIAALLVAAMVTPTGAFALLGGEPKIRSKPGARTFVAAELPPPNAPRGEEIGDGR